MNEIPEIKLCVLASGSTGNSIYISSNKTKILIDAGLSAKKIESKLGEIGVNPEHIDAICLSHEHSDHIQGARIFQKKYNTPVYANHGTSEAIKSLVDHNELKIQIFQTGSIFTIGNLSIESFLIPHDAFEPVGFKVTNGLKYIGVATDLGIITETIVDKFKECQLIVVEANYDEDLLSEAPRPWRLKQRIRSRKGHLSNMDTAKLIIECGQKYLKDVIICHLSSECNSKATALKTINSQLKLEGLKNINIEVSTANHPSEIWIG